MFILLYRIAHVLLTYACYMSGATGLMKCRLQSIQYDVCLIAAFKRKGKLTAEMIKCYEENGFFTGR